MAEQVKGGRALWGGHFATDPAPLMAQINASIGFDKRLAAHDLAGSRAHARMLAATAVIIAEAERDAILGGLEQIEAAIAAGTFEFTAELEDIHFNIEQRLTDLVGEPGRRLHTARSRNDQVATDFKLWVRDAMDRADALLKELQRVLLRLARAACRHGDAGLHPPAGGAAGHLRPSSAGLCRDARARPLALCRRARGG